MHMATRRYEDLSEERTSFLCGPLSWPSGDKRDLTSVANLQVKLRHGPTTYACTVEDRGGAGGEEGEKVTVTLEESDQGIAAGQYAVFYADGECLASGVMHG